MHEWALPQLSKLLPLDEESLKQILDYSNTLSKEAAAAHLKNLLGDAPAALEFIANFNSRRQSPQSASSTGPTQQSNNAALEVPKPKPRQKKPSSFNKLPPQRRPEDFGNVVGGYVKRDEQEYMAGQRRAPKAGQNSQQLALSEPVGHLSTATSSKSASAVSSRAPSPIPPPRLAGKLISDNIKPSRESSPAGKKTKVTITGGTAMHGQSEALNDLDSAIKALEIQTNPTLALSEQDNARRKCGCMAQRHPLLAAAPNCVNCGKIICVKEGLGPCTYCGSALLSPSEIASMVRILREERGKERQGANNASHKRADISKAPRPFATPQLTTPSGSTPASSEDESEKLRAAKTHRDKLLAFQAQNARRTRIHDEAADFETPDAGTNMWASPAERALQLKRQQKIMREQEWSARPEWEKRKVVASIDLVGGKVVRRMQEMERPKTPGSEDEGEAAFNQASASKEGSQGAFGNNPLLGAGLIKPVARVDEKGKGKERETERSTWRRVQDDNNDDNEQWILDGGLMGASLGGMMEKSQEPACG